MNNHNFSILLLSSLLLSPTLPCAALSEPFPSVDDELVQMGRSIPGFGGAFYDEQGYPTIYLREPESALAQLVVKNLGKEVRVLRGEFQFEDLVEWKRALRPMLAQPGVVFLDADEARNRVVIGVDTLQRKSLDFHRLDKELATHGVPQRAVVYQETQPFRELIGFSEARKAQNAASVLSTMRPVPGGVQLAYPDPPLIYFCTIGFNAYLGKAFGFVTNSHCSLDRGNVDHGRYSQGSFDSPTIASEIADPPYFTSPPCPENRKCRYSDSAFVQYDGNSTKLGGFRKLARTSARDPLFGSLLLKPTGARFTISSSTTPLVGEVVNKIGRSTGWTFGPVTATCVDLNSFLTVYTQFCQSVVRAGTSAGDSGSPVFSWAKGNDVKFLGLLWGGGTDSQGNLSFVFSPLENVAQELGTLRVK